MTDKADIAEQLSTIIFNLADIENFDPNIPLSELDLDPMELIEKLRAEFGVGIEKEQLENDVKTLDDLTVIYESALDTKQAPVVLEVDGIDIVAKSRFSEGAGTRMLEWQRKQEEAKKEAETDSAEIDASLDNILLEVTPEEAEAARQQYQSPQALEAAFDDDEKTQIFVPDPTGGFDDAIERRLQESIMLEPMQDALVDDTAPTQIYIPGKGDEDTQTDANEPKAEFDEEATQIVPPDEIRDEEISIAKAVQSLAEDATQIFMHDDMPASTIDHSAELDISSMIEQARAVRTMADEATQITEQESESLPTGATDEPVETLEPEITHVYRPSELSAEHEADETLLKQAQEHDSKNRTEVIEKWDGIEETQIYVPEFEDDAFVDSEGNIIGEQAGSLESVADESTQVFSPQSADSTEDTAFVYEDGIIMDDESVNLVGEQTAQMPSSTDEEALTTHGSEIEAFVSQPTLTLDEDEEVEAAIAELLPTTTDDIQVEESLVESADAEERTQIFIPERDSDEQIANETIIAEPEATIIEASIDDRTQIFIPSEDEYFDDSDSAAEIQDRAEVTQIFIPSDKEESLSDELAVLAEDERLLQIAEASVQESTEAGQDSEDQLFEGVEVDDADSADYQHPQFQPLTPFEFDLEKLPTAPDYQTVRTSSSHLGQFALIESDTDTHLSARQRNHLATLIDSVRQKTAKSRQHAERYRAIQAVPDSAETYQSLWKSISYPIVAARSKGSKLWDIDGNEYIDITLGGGAHFLGHAPDFVSGALSAEFAKGHEIGVQNRYAGEVAEAIRRLTDVERVTFVDSSSSAVQLALRLARLKSGRSKVIMFAGSYHGDFDEGLAQAQLIDGKLATRAAVPGVSDAAVQNVYVLEYDSPESLQFIRENSEEIAAVLVEPVQRHHPLRQPKQFLHELRIVTAQSDIALVFDESLTGFRVHQGGILQAWGIGADLIIYGSHLAAGLPIGVLAGSRRWLDGVDGGAYRFDDRSAPSAMRTFSGHQFAQHPFAMAAANSVLKYMAARGSTLQSQVNMRTERLAQELNAFFVEVSLPISVEQYSSWFKFNIPYDLSYAELLTYHLRENGVYVENVRQVNFISAEHHDYEIDRIVAAVKQSVHELQQSRLLPANDTTPFPLTDAQQSIWLAHQLGGEAATALNHTFVLDFSGDIDRDVLTDALKMVINRHQSLHLRFASDGSSQQYLNPQFSSAIEQHDLLSLTDEVQQERYWQLVDDMMLRPFFTCRRVTFPCTAYPVCA